MAAHEVSCPVQLIPDGTLVTVPLAPAKMSTTTVTIVGVTTGTSASSGDEAEVFTSVPLASLMAGPVSEAESVMPAAKTIVVVSNAGREVRTIPNATNERNMALSTDDVLKRAGSRHRESHSS